MPEKTVVPKLSELIDPLSKPEIDLADIVETTTGVRPPPGPMTLLKSIASAVETAIPAQLHALPTLVPKPVERAPTVAPAPAPAPETKVDRGEYRP